MDKKMRLKKVKSSKSTDLFRKMDFSRIEAAFALSIIRSTKLTEDKIEQAEFKASLASAARSAKFLDQYRSKSI
ncbi:MAG: hypothetical protein WAX04_11670 [Oscillospiraceae bacterium]